jgi:hypothetical protein
MRNFLLLWPMITSTYTPPEKDYEIVSFDDDEYELTGRSITCFRFRNERHQVTTWKQRLIELCKILYSENPSMMLYLANKDWWLHEKAAKDYSKVADKCYVHSSCSTNTKRTIITYIFKELNIAHSDLEFELAPIGDKVMDSEEE